MLQQDIERCTQSTKCNMMTTVCSCGCGRCGAWYHGHGWCVACMLGCESVGICLESYGECETWCFWQHMYSDDEQPFKWLILKFIHSHVTRLPNMRPHLLLACWTQMNETIECYNMLLLCMIGVKQARCRQASCLITLQQDFRGVLDLHYVIYMLLHVVS